MAPHNGSPTFDVKREQLLYLLEQGFIVPDISKIVGVKNVYKKNVCIWIKCVR